MVEYKATQAGQVYYISVKPGDAVKKGMNLVGVEMMKVQTDTIASVDGKVRDVKVKVNDFVSLGDVLLTTE